MARPHDQLQDLAAIHSLMERSSRFLSVSGASAIIAGLYALISAYIAYAICNFHPDVTAPEAANAALARVIPLAVFTLLVAMCTAFILSARKARHRREKAWSATSKRLLLHMAVPLLSGGLFILILLAKHLIGLLIPATLLFYGLALFSASKLTYDEVKSMGIIQIILGLLSTYFTSYGLLFWAAGFGIVHIIYGLYIHLKYER